MTKIKKGDFCLVMKKSLGEDGCRAGHKLRGRYYDTPCIVYKRYKSSCLLLPYSPAVLQPTRIKRQGKSFAKKLILVNFERIKKIPCPLKLLNLADLKTTFENIADILLKTHDTPIVSLINPDITGGKGERDSFFEMIRDPVISTRYPTQSGMLKTNTVYYSQLRHAVSNKSPIKFMNNKNNVLLFDHEKIIQIKSNFDPTCSYERTLSFLYDKRNPTENRSLDFGTENNGSLRAGNALDRQLIKRRKEILPNFRAFPFKALSDTVGSSIQSSISNVTIRSIHRDIVIEDLHNILDRSMSSSNRATSSKTNSFHSLDTGDEAQTSAQRNEHHDEGDDDAGEHHVNPEVQPQVSDIDPEDSIESIDCIESPIYSDQDFDIDIDSGQHMSDQSDEGDHEAAHSVVPPPSPNRSTAQKSICEEVLEAGGSPEGNSPLCGSAVARGSGRAAASKRTGKNKPIISISIHAPRIRDMNKGSTPSTTIPTKLPFQSAEDTLDKQ
jgi:hypothetical protein